MYSTTPDFEPGAVLNIEGIMKGKVAIVTGAGSGIGAACAREFAERGAAVVVADVNGETGNARAAEIVAAGGQAQAIRVNVADEADIQAMIQKAVETYGRLDILHNNAAATFESQGDDDLITTDPAVWDLT